MQVPDSAVQAAMARRADLLSDRPDPMVLSEETLTRLMLEAAAPILAEAVAQKITAHMEAHGPGPGSPGVTLHETLRRAWRRHFGIAARIAAGAFYTREDELRLAAEAIKRGDVIACDIPEVPAEPRLISEPVAGDEPWWCDCPERKGPHVHMPNWSGQGSSIALTALVDIETGEEIPGSRKAGWG